VDAALVVPGGTGQLHAMHALMPQSLLCRSCPADFLLIVGLWSKIKVHNFADANPPNPEQNLVTAELRNILRSVLPPPQFHILELQNGTTCVVHVSFESC